MKTRYAQVMLDYAAVMMEITVWEHAAGVARQLGRELQPADRISAVRSGDSEGYKKLYRAVEHMSPLKRRQFIGLLERQIPVLRQLLKQAKESGDPIPSQAFSIDLRDADTGAPIGAEPTLCPASGGGIPGAFVEAGRLIVQCPSCRARWDAHEIPFKLPNHEPMVDPSVGAR